MRSTVIIPKNEMLYIMKFLAPPKTKPSFKILWVKARAVESTAFGELYGQAVIGTSSEHVSHLFGVLILL